MNTGRNPPIFFVYLTTCISNGKRYIGKRKSKRIDDDYLGSGKEISRDIRKLGRDAFVRDILEVCHDEDHLAAREKFYIESFNAVADPDFYNLASGGEGGDTWAYLSPTERSEKAKERERNMSPEARARRREKCRQANQNKKLSQETKDKISASKKGVCTWSADTKDKYSARRKSEVENNVRPPPIGNRGNTSFKHTAETKQKISEACRRAKLTASALRSGTRPTS